MQHRLNVGMPALVPPTTSFQRSYLTAVAEALARPGAGSRVAVLPEGPLTVATVMTPAP